MPNILGGDSVDGYLAGEDRPSTVVEPKPRATGLTLDEIVADHLDYLHHEAFFVVSTTFEVTAYRTLWFGLQYDSETVEQGETVGNGALATVRWYDGEPVGDGHLQGQFAAFKDIVGRYCGLDTSGSAFYLAAWESDDPEVVRERLGRISRTVEELIDVLEEPPAPKID
jgi:hypothetical protein